MKNKTNHAAWMASFILMFAISGCSAKTAPVSSGDKEVTEERIAILVQEVEKETNPELTSSKSNDPCKYGKDSMMTIEKYSLYYEYFRQNNYRDAFPHWNYLITNAPCFNKGLYVNGADMLSDFIKDEKNEVRKEHLIDSLVMLYDMRIKYFGEEGFVLGKKGSDLFKFRPAAYEDAYMSLKKSVELEKNNASKTSLYYYAYTAAFMIKNKKITDNELINTFLSIMNIVSANNPTGTDAGWEAIYTNVVTILGNDLKCDILVSNFANQFQPNFNNIKILRQFQGTLEARKCIDNKSYLAISERIDELEPTAKSSYSLGIIHNNAGNNQKALFYFEKAYNQEEDKVLKSKYALSVAEVYRKIGNFPSARSFAQKAASANPEDGTPYIFIGNLYANSAKNCGTSAFEQNAVYWAAVDQYQIAKSKGSSEAQDQINRLLPAFPTKEQAFYQDPPVKDGDSFLIGCWINVTTTVRFIQ